MIATRVPAGGAQFVLAEVQAQQDQQEGNPNNWARDVQKGILDVVTPKECRKGDRHEGTVDQI